MQFLAIWTVDWPKVSELAFAAVLALIMGAVLNWLLLRRQERFFEKMERDRAANEEKMEKQRTHALATIFVRHGNALKDISREERNQEARLRSDDNAAARHRSRGS